MAKATITVGKTLKSKIKKTDKITISLSVVSIILNAIILLKLYGVV